MDSCHKKFSIIYKGQEICTSHPLYYFFNRMDESHHQAISLFVE